MDINPDARDDYDLPLPQLPCSPPSALTSTMGKRWEQEQEQETEMVIKTEKLTERVMGKYMEKE